MAVSEEHLGHLIPIYSGPYSNRGSRQVQHGYDRLAPGAVGQRTVLQTCGLIWQPSGSGVVA